MERDFSIWRDFDAVFLGRLVKGTYTMSREGLVTVKTPGGSKTTQLEGSPAIFVAKRLLRELAAEKKLAFMRSFLGKPLPAITLNEIDEGRDGAWTEALTDNYLKMKIRGKHAPNRWHSTRVTSIEDEQLISAEHKFCFPQECTTVS